MLSSLTRISTRNISKVAIIGGGQMGSGIAQVAASVGQTVTVIDVDQKVLDLSQKTITKSL